MDRKKFFKTSIGAAIATAVGSKLDWTLPKEEPEFKWNIPNPEPRVEALPGKDGKPFTVKFEKGWFRHGDIIVMGTGVHYHLVEKGGKLTGRPVRGNEGLPELIIEDLRSTEAVKICSVFQECV